MNHGKKLAKMIMAKQSKHEVAQKMGEEVEQVVEQDDTMEKVEMAQTQLHFICYAANEILEFVKMGGEVEEWYQNKLSKVHSDMESLHSYIEGEKRRTGMVKEEEEQIDEKAPPGAKFERMVKHIKKGYAKDGLTPKEKSIAYATAWKAYNKKNEEVEQIDELKKTTLASYVNKAYGDRISRQERDALDFARKTVDARDKKQLGNTRQIKGLSVKMSPDEREKNLHKAYNRDIGVSRAVSKLAKEEVVTEAEGTVAVTPREKALAAHHGDPKKITYGDVIKARLKSAAAKKMGK